jgi:hypothetical protein
MTGRPEVVPLIAAIEKERGSRVLTYYLVPGPASMAMDALRPFEEQLMEMGPQRRIDLWILSSGGQTEMPWRLVQTIRSHTDNFGVLVSGMATSAATHVALGANEIVMGPFGLLSPVDPSHQHPLLPKGTNLSDPTGDPMPFPVSVQNLKHAVSFIKREAGKDGLSGEAYSQVMSELFNHVHPLAIGSLEQSYELSKLVTRRMLSTHMDEKADAEEIERLANTLCDDYKSHSFPIGRPEAHRLGLKVTDASDALHKAMIELERYYENLDRNPAPAASMGISSAGSPGMKAVPLGHIDSTQLQYDCLSLQDGHAKAIGGMWAQRKRAAAPTLATPASPAATPTPVAPATP